MSHPKLGIGLGATADDTDSEEELPAGWEVRASLDGQVYYLNHQAKSSHWEHPITGKRSFIKPDLPPGWEMTATDYGNLLFFDRVRGLQSHTDPRLAFSKASTPAPPGASSLTVLANHDLTGRVAMVTGASSGIGFETARAIAIRGAKVILACRCPQLGTAAANKIRTELPSASVEVWQVELASLRSVLSFCRRYMASGYPLHVLILNAGVCGPAHTITEDGIELQFQVNHLSQLYLMRLLYPLCWPRLLLDSESHRSTSITRETFDEAQPEPDAIRGCTGAPPAFPSTATQTLQCAHALDLLINILHLAVFVGFSVHPGNMVFTGIQRQWWLSRLVFVLARPFTKTVEQGAATSVLAAFDPTIEQYGGGYFNNCTPCARPSDLGRDPSADRQAVAQSATAFCAAASPSGWPRPPRVPALASLRWTSALLTFSDLVPMQP
uniref:WW domain-containing oxidoreductase n=1 Tax=Macrostomum lignano TaxID=282301 RepID=A0A1I8HD31_9PLAT